MNTGFYRNLGLAALVCSVLVISACATVKPEDAATEKAMSVTQDASRTVMTETEGKLSNTVDQVDVSRSPDQVKTASQINTEKAASQQNITAKINPKDKRVKVKSAASNKSRTIARLQGGKQIEILEEKGSWLKIRWQEKDKAREGWSRKEHIDMTP